MQKNTYTSNLKLSSAAIVLALGLGLTACNSDVSNDSDFVPVSYTHLTLPTKA